MSCTRNESVDAFLRSHLSGRKVPRILDAATGEGEFLGELVQIVGDYEEAIGVDLAEDRLVAARQEFTDGRMRFECMDAFALQFEGGFFDLVAVRNSLHHVNQPRKLLLELTRVLKPGGWFVVVEQIQDNLNRQQDMHREMHHWWGAVHRLQGKVHNETFYQKDLSDLIDSLNLSTMDYATASADTHDPFDPDRLAALDKIMQEHLEDLVKIGGQDKLIASGQELRQKLPRQGVAWATHLAAVGTK